MRPVPRKRFGKWNTPNAAAVHIAAAISDRPPARMPRKKIPRNVSSSAKPTRTPAARIAARSGSGISLHFVPTNRIAVSITNATSATFIVMVDLSRIGIAPQVVPPREQGEREHEHAADGERDDGGSEPVARRGKPLGVRDARQCGQPVEDHLVDRPRDQRSEHRRSKERWALVRSVGTHRHAPLAGVALDTLRSSCICSRDAYPRSGAVKRPSAHGRHAPLMGPRSQQPEQPCSLVGPLRHGGNRRTNRS